jgi:hypothetical protein
MTTLYKFILILALSFAVLSERNVGFQVDSIGVATQNDMAPYIKITQGESIYLLNLQSIYEIYFDNATNQWIKDVPTETKLSTLKWNVTANLLKGYASLLGAPCPCENEQNQNVEPFPVTRNIGRQVRDDPFEDLTCSTPNFGYFRLVFQDVAAENNSNCAPAELSQCTDGCSTFCNNVTNAENCNNGCNAIKSGSVIDTNDCYTACNISGVSDADCLNGCMNMVDCLIGLSCRLDIGFHLHNYTWVNATALRKLVFAFEIVPEPTVNVKCGAEVATWIQGPFLLWINTTSLAVQHQDGCVDCLPDLATAVMVPSSVLFAPGASSVIGRVYVDPFTSGFSIFNNPVEMANMINTSST